MANTETPADGTAVEAAPPAPKVPEAEPKVRKEPKARPRNHTRELPPYHVVLLNDEEHSYDYVIEMLRALFGHPAEKGFQLATRVDKTGRAVVMTTHKEKAELKRDQIHAYGRDFRMSSCKGSMSALIEPAEGEE